MRRWFVLSCALALVANAVDSFAGPPLPAAPRRPVSDTYWGRTVTEDYPWLEDWKDPAVPAWSDSQNAVTRAFLDSLPMRPAVLARVEELTRTPFPSWYGVTEAGGAFFALKNQPPKQQPLLVRLRSLDDLAGEQVLVDPNVLDSSGGTAIDFFVPSPDGARVAVSLSQGGSEAGTVRVWDVRSAKFLPDVVPGVNGGTAGGSLAWKKDGSGFWRTRYPAAGERPEEDLAFYQQVWFHRLGTPAESDVYVVGREFPKIAEIELDASKDGRWVLADVANGDGGDHAFWLAAADGPGPGRFLPLTGDSDQVVEAAFGKDALYLLSRLGAPNGRVLRLSLDRSRMDVEIPLDDSGAEWLTSALTQPKPPSEAELRREWARPHLRDATVIVPPGDSGIEWLLCSGDLLYVEEIVGGPSRLRVLRADGTDLGEVPLPDPSTVGSAVALGGGRVALGLQRYTEPGLYVTWDPARKRLQRTALVSRSPADFSDIEVRTEMVTSRDGTRVPLTLLVPKGVPLDGSAPTLLTGYGGYGISQRPGFSAARRVWFDQGGIVAIAHTRGGGEFGDAWHRDGNLTRKQNVFDDFAACGRWLVDHRVTSTARLGIQGGSNGGLLMGAMVTQHPDLFRAVVSSVGLYDMLRVELSPNGAFNVTEFGTVKDSAQFAALYAYSPYHHVTDGTAYPAVLFTTGANDPRVDPANSRKMAARLQAASSSGHPVLLRTDAKTGHGIGSPLSARNELSADIFSFLFSQLGVDFREPGPHTVKPSLEPVKEAGRK